MSSGTTAALVTVGPTRRLPRPSVPLVVGALLLAGLGLMAVAPGLFTGTDPYACNLSNSLDPPSAGHPFGYDLLGCDYYARTIYAARLSLLIGLSVVAGTTVIGTLLGALSGYYGGWLDRGLRGLADVWLSAPLVVGGLVILSFLEHPGALQVITVLVLLGWPPIFAVMRATVLETKHRDYVTAARALGAGDLRILSRHVVPLSLAPVIVYATAYTGVAISAEAILSFLGLGLQLPALSWGLQLSDIGYRLLEAPHLLIPGAFLALAVLAFVLLGEALTGILEPARVAARVRSPLSSGAP